jgi:hypothetical protein
VKMEIGAPGAELVGFLVAARSRVNAGQLK